MSGKMEVVSVNRTGGTVLALVLTFGCGGASHHDEHAKDAAHVAHWGYEPNDGPARWGSLSPEWTTCDTGRSQSPLDIRDAKVTDVSRLSISLPTTDKRVIAHQDYVVDALDNGHTIQVNVNDAETLTFDGQTYDLRPRRDRKCTSSTSRSTSTSCYPTICGTGATVDP
jgi:carbonic anhydrase